MGNFKVLALVFIILLSACSSKMFTAPVKEQQAVELDDADEIPPMIMPKRTVIKIFDPFEGKSFTFSAKDVPVQTVLYTIAVDTGLNLVINPDVTASDTVSANFINTPMRDAIDIVMDMSDLFYEVRGNVLRIHKYGTVNFNIPYVSVLAKHSTTLGGDVVGGVDKDGDTNLKGEFILDYNKKEADGDFYKQLEENIKTIIEGDPASKYTVNKLASIITVHTTHNKMEQVKKLVNNVVDNSVRQVQIEAKIVEVALSDSMSYGIDWTRVFKEGSFGVNIPTGDKSAAGALKLAIGTSFNSMITAISQYGKVDTLSNPRLTVLNGQSAMISAGTITPFWEKEIKTNIEEGVVVKENSYNKYNVLDGVMIGLTAYIHDDDTIMLNITPITTSIQDSKKLVDNNEEVAVAPLIDIKEVGTVVQVEDGAVLVIGGLITNEQTTRTTSVPILGSIPILGYLFSSDYIEMEKKELVIFIKPTIVKSKSRAVIK